MRAKRCETCGAWEEPTCRKYAPKAAALPNEDVTIWPKTDKDEWCLEWVPKENDPGDVLERVVERITERVCQAPAGRSSVVYQDCLAIIEEERNREAKNV